MSRVGKLPVAIPQGVQVNIAGQQILVKGGKGELSLAVPPEVGITVTDGKVELKPANDSKRARAMWGMARSIVSNMVTGVSQGFIRKMEVNGVGYRAAVEKGILTMTLGYSHEIKYVVPKGVEIKCEKPTLIVISGPDKRQVGQVAAQLRVLRKPEPYKGKGVRYEGERVRMKEGKKK